MASKTYADTYLFRQYSEYEKQMYEFIMNCARIDINSKEFAEILYDFKRRAISSDLVKILTSKNVILGIANKPLPKAFKVFVAKDLKEGGTSPKVFIDISECVILKNGIYICNKMEWLVSYVINAMVSYIYAMAENKITNNASVLKDGGMCFVNCFSYIIDRMYKLSTVQQLMRRLKYISGIYYQVCLLGKDISKNSDIIKANSIRYSDIEQRDAQIVDAMLNPKGFANIDIFTQELTKIFNFKDLKTSNIVGMWMSAFGTGTVFSLEYFPAFSQMLTNTYVGGYIDQQITIEKIAGPSMVTFTKTILQIGASV